MTGYEFGLLPTV